MIEVIGVRFSKSGFLNYYDPGQAHLEIDQGVIVNTDRGIEYGTVVIGNTSLPDEGLAKKIQPIIRVADEEDDKIYAKNQQMAEDAFYICEEKIDQHGLNMKLVSSEYTFDRNKLIFYFIAENRVDFRKLVRDLAWVFHTRIELRQIGVRDQAKMLGGIGPCGQEVCCHRYIMDFEPVSIRMAKSQGLSLNPTKISGICGRLMCCLNYEEKVYKENTKEVPPTGSLVLTKDGQGYVVDRDVLQKRVRARIFLQDGSEDEQYYGLDEIELLDRRSKGQSRPSLWSPDRLAQHEFVSEAEKRAARAEANDRKGRHGQKNKPNREAKQKQAGGSKKTSQEGKDKHKAQPGREFGEKDDHEEDETPYLLKGKARKPRRGRRRKRKK